MKGLLKKDFYQIWGYYKMYFAMTIIMELAAIWARNMFFVVYPIVMLCMLPTNLQTLDENGKWDVYCGTLPCTRAQVVTGKYLIGLIVTLPVVVLAVTCQSVGMKMNGMFIWGEVRGLLVSCLGVSLTMPMVSLPLIFKFGAVKSRVVTYVGIAFVVGAVTVLGLMLESDQMPALAPGASILGVALLAGLYLLSWYLSIRFYEKRNLG